MCIYFNIKYRFCENSNKAGPMALNPHDDNIHTYKQPSIYWVQRGPYN